LGHVHFVGICGVGMAGLAFHLKHKGWRVSGCDSQSQPIATWLTAAGIEIQCGHDCAHLVGVDWVVRTTAVRADHPEILAAATRGLPVFQRGVVLAALLSGCPSIIVSGTHGKTTTTAMLAQILLAAGRDPSFCIGGESVLGGVAGAPFVVMFTLTQNRWKIDDVLGVWPLHGLCGAWGGIAAGIFGMKALGGLGGVSFMSQLIGTLMGIGIALAGGFLVYGAIKKLVGIRLDKEEEFNGADLSIHKISATPERESGW